MACVIYPTYRSACEKLGLLGDEDELNHTLEYAVIWASLVELRQLFFHILLHCDDWHRMSDDSTLRHGLQKDNNKLQYVLYDLQFLLYTMATPSSLSAFGLLLPNPITLAMLDNTLLMDERNYDRDQLAAQFNKSYILLHEKHWRKHSGSELCIWAWRYR